ncbi:type II toxin-antitoxin system RelE/ParE family toxin (plasmid) [Alkalihalophilus sp. As8PL]|uniref:Type II toxin-antitoxin system RelE/ParE family toxin n=1 Tax=Alkalihalophilus sp. As8PL TaxID=3237103 RepID=A0AB39BNM2_9BACI
MDIYYKTKKLKKKLDNPREMVKEWGSEQAKKLMRRLNEIKSVDCLADLYDLPAVKCHQLSNNRDNQFAVTLKEPYRLIFEPYHEEEPVPLKADGGFDTSRISSILIIEVVDYHGT